MSASSVSWDTVCAVLDAVADLPPAARSAYLAALPEPDVRREVHAYLAYEDAFAPALDGLEAAGPTLLESVLLADAEQAWPAPGTAAGPYRLVRLAGEGGFGAVYEALDDEAERTVALKLLARRHADLPVRLRREIRALARLDHPHVARFYAAGALDDGRPFFAMEWVDGPPLTDFARAHGLSLEARVRLLEQVCAAVQHAHERFVLHRDLKPANVLVAGPAHAPQAKVVDFGIGKRLDDEAGREEAAPYLRLTPHYAAPEQLRGEPASVASDVFSLGVLGRELLLADAPAPGQRVERGALPGDLRAILAKALDPAPSRRYPTAAALQADLVRARTGLVTTARTVSRAERARRFVQRHRARVAAASLAALALAGATAFHIRTLTTARQRADREAAASAEAVGMLTAMFRHADPLSEQTDTLRMKQVVAQAAAQFLAHPPRDPVVRARLACSLADIQAPLGDTVATPTLFARCLERPAGPAPRWYVDGLVARATYASVVGRVDELARYARAAVREANAAFGARSATRATALVALGTAYLEQSRLDSSLATLEEARALLDALPEATPDERAHAYDLLGQAYYLAGRYDEALAAQAQVQRFKAARFGPGHPVVASQQLSQADILSAAGRHAEALALYRRILAALAPALGAEHPTTLTAAAHFATAFAAAGQNDSANARLRAVVPTLRRRLGTSHALTLSAQMSLAGYLASDGEGARAVALLRESHDAAMRAFGPENYYTLAAQAGLGSTLLRLGRAAEAEAVLRALVPAYRKVLGQAPPVQEAEGMLANALRAQRRMPEAEATARRALGGFTPDAPASNYERLFVQRTLGQILVEAGKLAEAEPVLRAQFDATRGTAEAHADAADALAALYARLRRPADARRYADSARAAR